jgi:rRNA maturation protein Rpf1
MFTTSRYASKETRKFAKELAKSSDSIYTSRGKKQIDALVEFARKKGEHRICVVLEKNKKPSRINFIEVKPDGRWIWLKEETGINEA